MCSLKKCNGIYCRSRSWGRFQKLSSGCLFMWIIPVPLELSTRLFDNESQNREFSTTKVKIHGHAILLDLGSGQSEPVPYLLGKGSSNLADYFTKHYPPDCHRKMRSTYVLNKIVSYFSIHVNAHSPTIFDRRESHSFWYAWKRLVSQFSIRSNALSRSSKCVF